VGSRDGIKGSYIKPDSAHIAAEFLNKSKLGTEVIHVTMPDNRIDEDVERVGK
jgi:hypothetical protein